MGIRGVVAGTRRGVRVVRAAGLRGAAGPCRRAVPAPPLAAELVPAQFDTVAAAAEECDAPVATGVMPTGAWR